jgi:hypothetical protein
MQHAPLRCRPALSEANGSRSIYSPCNRYGRYKVTRHWLPSRFRCNSLKTNDRRTSYPSLKWEASGRLRRSWLSRLLRPDALMSGSRDITTARSLKWKVEGRRLNPAEKKTARSAFRCAAFLAACARFPSAMAGSPSRIPRPSPLLPHPFFQNRATAAKSGSSFDASFTAL